MLVLIRVIRIGSNLEKYINMAFVSQDYTFCDQIFEIVGTRRVILPHPLHLQLELTCELSAQTGSRCLCMQSVLRLHEEVIDDK